MTTVAIVEDHALVRESLVTLIQTTEDLEVVAEAGDALHAMPQLRGARPDVVILDITLPGESGIDLARRIHEEMPGTAVVFVSVHEDELTLQRAMAAGAEGYVPKTAPAAELLEALRIVGAGGSYISPELAHKVMELASGRRIGPGGGLTERELEILELLAHGERAGDIAEALFLSVKTVKNHLTRIYRKLGVSSASQAVAEAYRSQLIQTDEPLDD